MTARIDTTRSASIHFRCGSSGSGKSWGVKEAIKKASRLIVFDPDNEYGSIAGIHTIKSTTELIQLIGRYPKGALKVRLVANGEKAFNVWCKVVFAWCNCVAVAEEIAGVTSPSKASDGWHTLISRGRKRGIDIYAVTQRPAECDKTVVGNATTMWCGRMTRAKDRKYMSEELDINRAELNQLSKLDFIHKNFDTGEIYKGRMGTKQHRKIQGL